MGWKVEDVLNEIDTQAPKFGVDPLIAKAIVLAENTSDGKLRAGSIWENDATSPAGARGIMQVMPGTARGLQKVGLLPAEWKHDPSNLSSQVSAGLAAIKDTLSRTKNPSDPYEIAAGFNGSPAVQRTYQGGQFNNLPTETRNYFVKVRNALMDLGSNQTNLGVPVTTSATPNQSSGSSTSSTTSISRKVGDPEVMSQMLMDGFGLVKPGGGYDQLSSGVAQAAQARQAGFDGLLTAILTSAKAEGDKVTAEAAIDAGEAARRKLILGKTNLNPMVADNVLDQTVSVINQTDEQLRSMKPEIDARMFVGFFDNPLQWLVNQTRLPGMVAQYNAVASTQNAAIDKFKNVATIAGTEQQLSQTMDADAILRKGTAQAAAKAAAAQAELAKAQVESATANTRDYLTLAHIVGERFNTEYKLFAATSSTQAERKGESAREAAARTDQENLDNVNRLITAAGGNGLTLTQFKSMSASAREDLVQRSSTGKFGKDFGESFTFQDSLGNRRVLAEKGGATSVNWMNDTQREAMQIVQDTEAKWQRTNPGKLLTAKQKNEMMLDALNQVQTRYEYDYNNDMRMAKDGNPYKLSYVAISKLPEMKNNPLAIYINTYGPEAQEPVFKDVDEKYIMDRFVASISSGKMTPADASRAISDFYKFGIQRQTMSTAYPLYGMNPATQYNVKLRMGTIGNNVSKVDLTNPAQVEKFLTGMVASRKTEAILLRGSTGFNIYR